MAEHERSLGGKNGERALRPRTARGQALVAASAARGDEAPANPPSEWPPGGRTAMTMTTTMVVAPDDDGK